MPSLDKAEVEELARAISERVWAKVRGYVRRSQRELHDDDDEDEELIISEALRGGRR